MGICGVGFRILGWRGIGEFGAAREDVVGLSCVESTLGFVSGGGMAQRVVLLELTKEVDAVCVGWELG